MMSDLQSSVKKTTSILDITEDNLVEIFLRLPVRSVLSCKCVCRGFCTVIGNTEFRNRHVNHVITSNTSTFCLVKLLGTIKTKECGGDWFNDYPNGLILLEKTDHSTSSLYVRLSNPITCDISLVGSCNGLLCAELKTSDHQDGHLLIWNPVTRENRYVLKPKIIAPGPTTTLALAFGVLKPKIIAPGPTTTLALAFGFTSETNDYKVVRIISCCIVGDGVRRTFYVAVYKMSSDDWSTYEVASLPCCEPDYIPQQVNPNLLITVRCPRITQSLRGAFHWLCNAPRAQDGIIGKAIMSFDLKTEELKLFTVLDRHKFPLAAVGVLGSLNDSLALFVPHLGINYPSFDIWVMNDYGNRKSWSKQLTVDQFRGVAGPVGYWKEDLFVLAKTCGPHMRLLCLYNLKTQDKEWFPVASIFRSATFCDYVETLETTVSRALTVAGDAVQ